MRIKKIIVFLLCITGSTFIFYDHSYSKENTQAELVHIQTINERIQETDLTRKIISELQENGYEPGGRVTYTLYPNNQQMTIFFHEIDKTNQKTLGHIESIVNTVLEKHDFQPFIVEVQEEQK